MGSFDWASSSKIAKHLSMAGTLLNAGGISGSKAVPYRKRMFFMPNKDGECQEKRKRSFDWILSGDS
jgi:hypothetical protein